MLVKNDDQTKMEEGEYFAIETFGSTGRGMIVEGVRASPSSGLDRFNIVYFVGRLLALRAHRGCSECSSQVGHNVPVLYAVERRLILFALKANIRQIAT